MKPFIPLFNSPEENRFKTIAEFKNCLQWGAKLELEWKGVHFGIIRYGVDAKLTA